MKDERKHILLKSALGILVAAVVILTVDFILAYYSKEIRVRYFIPAALLLCAFLAYAAVKLPRLWKALITIFVSVYGFMAAFMLLWYAFLLSSAYHAPDSSDKSELFSGKNVMLIVPHEDDDLNLLGGVIEEYASCGSTVRVVFTTNGDFYGRSSGYRRINEAIDVLTELGLPESDIIFLGYSDCMSLEKEYFYDLKNTRGQAYSFDRKISATYGTAAHSAYNGGNSFSRAHLTQDLKSCILEYRPDTVICVDHDGNLDHIALTLIFDEVMGEILSQHTDYKPLVLKGFAYSTAFFAEPDFYRSVNIISTVKLGGGRFMDENHAYLWADRLRLPVCADSLSRSMLGCRMWKSSQMYGSQEMFRYTKRVTNGDKVFWPRYTDSLTYAAAISASSGNADVLSDFCLEDRYAVSKDITARDGLWTPSAGDTEPWINISLPAPSEVVSVRLYDAPSLEDNILSATLIFDNGNTYETGPLAPNGSATEIEVRERDVSSMRIEIKASEGAAPGLTELEMYADIPEPGLRFIKLTDAQGNFIYDYVMDKSGEEEFSLYALGCPGEINGDNYVVTSSNARCSARIEKGKLRVNCPPGARTVLKIQSADGTLSDSVYLQNPLVSLLDFWMHTEERIFDEISGIYVQPVIIKIWRYITGA